MKYFFAIVFASAILFIGCDKDDDDSTVDTNNYFSIQFNNLSGNEDLIYSKPVYNEVNRQLYFTISRYYISSIDLYKEGGGITSIDTVLLVKPESKTAFNNIAIIQPGKYNGISFNVGLDTITNASNPDDFPDNHPLARQENDSMFWNPFNGYIFLKLSGMVDTTTANTGVINKSFTFEYGKDENLVKINLDRPFEIKDDFDINFVVEVDHLLLLENIDMQNQFFLSQFGPDTISNQIKLNIQNAFN